MGFDKILKTWYLENKRCLPWRGKTDPYLVWLSEIILQQTQVNQGLAYFERILKTYPNVSSLAAANENDLLVLWQGLGYYSRALNLLKTARIVQNEMGGTFPDTAKGLMTLPGIGYYTAAAMASFCYKEVIPVLDGNVYRVMTRYYGIQDPINTGACQRICLEKLNKLIPSKEPDTFNQAIMEFGALHCTPKSPRCVECPFGSSCVAYQTNQVSVLPIKKKPKAKQIQYRHYFLVKAEDEVAVLQRDDTGIWKNLYELPVVVSSVEVKLKEVVKAMDDQFGIPLNERIQIDYSTTHVLSHIKMDAFFYVVELPKKFKLKRGQWVKMDSLKDLAFHQLIRKYFKSFGLLG